MPASLHQLPGELLDQIIQYADLNSLAALCQTCRALSPTSYQALYSSINWDYDESPNLRLDLLFRTLEEQPDLASRVTDINFHGSHIIPLLVGLNPAEDDATRLRFSIVAEALAKRKYKVYGPRSQLLRSHLLLMPTSTNPSTAEIFVPHLLRSKPTLHAHDIWTSLIIARLPILQRLSIGWRLLQWDHCPNFSRMLNDVATSRANEVLQQSQLEGLCHLNLSADISLPDPSACIQARLSETVSQVQLNAVDLLSLLLRLRLESLSVMITAPSNQFPIADSAISSCETLTSLVLHHSELTEPHLGKILKFTPRLTRLRYEALKYLLPRELASKYNSSIYDCAGLMESLSRVQGTLERLELAILAYGCISIYGKRPPINRFRPCHQVSVPICCKFASQDKLANH